MPILVYHGACDSSPMVAMSEEISIERAGFVERAIVRHRAGQSTDAIDRVAAIIWARGQLFTADTVARELADAGLLAPDLP